MRFTQHPSRVLGRRSPLSPCRDTIAWRGAPRPYGHRRIAAAASHESDEEKLSDEYSEAMTARMGAPLTYRHEDGMNYDRILPDLIVGSCLQVPEDADRLADEEGVRTVLCLQEASDQEYFSLDIGPIRERCRQRSSPTHLRHAIRDFDPYSLRRRLPSAVALLARHAAAHGGTAYVHCTAGLGRAPATALAYMWWIKGIPLEEGHALLTGLRPCFPKLAAIRAATVDLLYGGEDAVPVTITLSRRGTAQVVEVAGLDVGWGQKVALQPDSRTKKLAVRRRLPPGQYQYKFIWDGQWGTSMDHPTLADGGNLNNVVTVRDPDLGAAAAAARERLRAEGGELTEGEAAAIRAKLAALEVSGDEASAP